MKNKKISNKIYALINFLFPVLVFAQTIKIDNPLNPSVGTSIMQVLTAILRNVVMPVAAVLVVMYIIYSGFLFVTAQGKPAELEKAKRNLLWALIGAGILLGAEAISLVVQNTASQLLAP